MVHIQLARDLVDRAVSSFHINTVCLDERENKRATEAEVDSTDSSALEPEMHTGLTQEMENLDIVDDFERKVGRKCCSNVQIDGNLQHSEKWGPAPESMEEARDSDNRTLEIPQQDILPPV